MRKAKTDPEDDELRPEYDFSAGVRGKYSKRFAEGTNVVLLDPDVARAFPDSASVNSALRLLMDLVRRINGRRPKRPSGTRGRKRSSRRAG